MLVYFWPFGSMSGFRTAQRLHSTTGYWLLDLLVLPTLHSVVQQYIALRTRPVLHLLVLPTLHSVLEQYIAFRTRAVLHLHVLTCTYLHVLTLTSYLHVLTVWRM